MAGLFGFVSSLVIGFLHYRVSGLNKEVSQLTENLAFQKKAAEALANAINRDSENKEKLKKLEEAVKNADGETLDSIYNNIISSKL